MPSILLLGRSGSGRGDVVRALSDPDYRTRPVMAVRHAGPFVITPGEFLENRRFHRALITTAAACDTVVLVQNARHTSSPFPPRFAAMFTRRVLGIVTCADALCADVERAQRFLQRAGARTVFISDLDRGRGGDALREMLG